MPRSALLIPMTCYATNRTAMKRIANLAMALVLAATLLWGGCLSCSQYFMAAAVARKDCCEPDKCKKSQSKPSAQEECRIQQMALKSVPTVPVRTSVQVASFDVLPSLAAQALPLKQSSRWLPPGLADRASPPDLCLLHSVFLI